jgi:hypothetical protein
MSTGRLVPACTVFLRQIYRRSENDETTRNQIAAANDWNYTAAAAALTPPLQNDLVSWPTKILPTIAFKLHFPNLHIVGTTLASYMTGAIKVEG